MAVYKRGGIYWYKFCFKGECIRESARTSNKEAARQIEAAHRLKLAKGEAGIKEQKTAPMFSDFAPRFEAHIATERAEKPETIRFYRSKLRRLLEDPVISGLRLDAIDNAVIDDYKTRRRRQASRYGRPVSPASVNRELATLRRLLRVANKWKELKDVPEIELLDGERIRDFVLSHSLEGDYLAAAPQPLKDVAILILETGMRPGEAANLRWRDVYLQPAVRAKYGYAVIREGKSENAKRNLSLSAAAAAMLKTRKGSTKSAWVFPGESPDFPILVTSLDHQHAEVRAYLQMTDDFVPHSLRHTMLTRLGEAGADAFTIMRIAGHSSVIISQRYVHPTPEGLERAFERLAELNAAKYQEAALENDGTENVGTKTGTAGNLKLKTSPQVVAIKRAGP